LEQGKNNINQVYLHTQVSDMITDLFWSVFKCKTHS